MSDLDSKLQKKPSNPHMLIKNVHSQATFQSEEKFLKVSAFQQKCKEPLLSEETIFIMSRNTTDTKKDTETFQSTVHPPSQLKKVTLLLLVNADLSAKQSTSMS